MGSYRERYLSFSTANRFHIIFFFLFLFFSFLSLPLSFSRSFYNNTSLQRTIWSRLYNLSWKQIDNFWNIWFFWTRTRFKRSKLIGLFDSFFDDCFFVRFVFQVIDECCTYRRMVMTDFPIRNDSVSLYKS